MPAGNTINYNSTVVSPTSVNYNGSDVTEIILDGTSVWLKCYTAGTATTLQTATLANVGNEVNTQVGSYTVARCGTYNVVYYYSAVWKGVRTDIRVNGSTVHSHNHVDGSVSTKTTSGTYTTTALSAGDVITIWQEPFHPWSGSGGGNWQIKVG